MAIQIVCDHCDRNLRLRDELAGKKIRCPDCQAILAVQRTERSSKPQSRPARKKKRRSKRRFPASNFEDSYIAEPMELESRSSIIERQFISTTDLLHGLERELFLLQERGTDKFTFKLTPRGKNISDLLHQENWNYKVQRTRLQIPRQQLWDPLIHILCSIDIQLRCRCF